MATRSIASTPMTTINLNGVHHGGRARTAMSSGERTTTKSPRVCGRENCLFHVSVSMTQMPVTDTVLPISIPSAHSGALLQSTGIV